MKKNFEDELQSLPQGQQESSSFATVDCAPEESLDAILNVGLKKAFGENFDINNKTHQEALLEYVSINKEQNEKLAEVLQRDPRLAQMLIDILDGKRSAHSALARYFGGSMSGFREGTPEFEEMMLADEERREELMRAASERHAYEENLTASRSVIEGFCKERGYEPADFMNRIWESLVLPILSGNYTREVCMALDNALNYEQDVENAFAAGDIKGRNTNIQRMREDLGDGLPKGMSSAAPQTSVKRRYNSLIEDALNA